MENNKIGTALLICLLIFSMFTVVLPQVYAVKPPGVGKPENPGKPGETPGIMIEMSVKDGDDWVEGDSAPGPTLSSGPVEFKVLVTNTGDVTLMKISITDNASNTVTELKSMGAGETWEQTYSVDWASGQQAYSASVEYVYHGTSHSDTDYAYYVGLEPNPSIQVVKTASLGLAQVGETVTYTFTVTNPGNVPLSGISVEDTVTGDAAYVSGDVGNVGFLDTSETWVYTDTWTVESSPDPLVNTVTATGYYDSTSYTDTDTYSLDVTEPGPSPNTLLSNNLENSGHFGYATAIGGGYIFVGADDESLDVDYGPYCVGRVHVYDAESKDYVKTLVSPNYQEYGSFGFTVVVKGNYLLVSALYESVGETIEAGAAYVYTLDDLDAEPVQLVSPHPQENGQFGISLGANGAYAFVGAINEEVEDTNYAGIVHVFSLSDGTYIESVTEPTPTQYAYFGETIAVSDTKLYVSTLKGKVYVYSLSDLTSTNTLETPSAAWMGYFGMSISVGGDYVFVGAPGECHGGTGTDSGRVHVYNAGNHSYVGTIDSPNPTQGGCFGDAVACDGTYVVIGAPYEVSDSGKAYVYSISGLTATPVILSPPDSTAKGRFGSWHSVAISEGTVVIGAYKETVEISETEIYTHAGRAYVFTLAP